MSKSICEQNIEFLLGAIKSGKKYKCPDWGMGSYLVFKGGELVDDANNKMTPAIHGGVLYEYVKEEPEMVTWYRPKAFWEKGSRGPRQINYWYLSKDQFNTKNDEKSIGWEEMQAPAKWEDWE